MSNNIPSPTRPRRLAVLCGISNYTQPFPLVSSVATDIDDLANMLRQGLDEEFRYDKVEVYKDEEVTQQKLKDILINLAKDNPIDELLFYLAGHGCVEQSIQEAYFVTYAVELVNPGISLNHLSKLLQKVKPQKVFVVLDFCHAGKFVESLGLQTLKRDDINLASTEKLAILAAARSGESAVAGNQDNLSFTQYFIKALTNATTDENGYIRWAQVGISVCAAMERSLYQTPVDHCDCGHLKAHIINRRVINDGKSPNNDKSLNNDQLSVTENNEEVIKTYRSKLLEQLNKVRIFGESQERELKQIFVELTIVEEYERPSEALPRDLLDRLSLEQRYSFLKQADNTNDKSNKQIKTTKKPEELLKEGSRALIVGAPGAGKSVLMKYLTLQTLLSDRYIDRLPIFIELKTISQDKFIELKEDFENLLVENIVNKATGLNDSRAFIHKHLQELLKAGKVSIFLDGLDEIKAASFFPKLCESISVFLKATNSSNNLIISSRPYALGAKFESIKEMEIAPLSHKQIKEFVNCYYPGDSTNLIKQLERKEQKDLTRVPLLLSILISLYHKGQTVDNRLDLYKLLTNHLVTVIDETKNVDRNFHIADKDGALILDLLKELGFDKLFDNNIHDHSQRFTFTSDEILKKAKQFCSNTKEAHLLVKDVKSVAIVREIANQTYAFTHLTIQEYLAALVLSEKSNSEQLICQTYFDEILVQLEVLPMAIALRQNPTSIYQQLRDLPESLDYINFRLRIRAFTYIAPIYKDSLSDEIKDISNNVIDLIIGKIPSQTLYKEDIFSAISSCIPIYLDTIAGYLIELLDDSDSDVRSSAAYALGNIGSDKATNSLTKALEDSDWGVQFSAAYALGNIGSDKATDSLIKALDDSDSDVRSTAADALGKIGSDKATDSLIKALDDSDRNVRSTAAEALGKIGNDKATDSLINDLDHYDWGVGSRAANALGKIGSDKATSSLIKALEDSDWGVRSRAANALGKIGSDKATNSLINALDHSHRNVRSRAATSLKQIKGKLEKQERNLFSQILVKAVNSTNIITKRKVIKIAGYYTKEKELITLLDEIIGKDLDLEIRNIASLELSRYQNKLKLFGYD